MLQALARLFGFDRSLRSIRRSDFHVSSIGEPDEIGPRKLWIEAQFEFSELKESKGKHATIPSFLAHMQLVSADSVPRIRFRLVAEMDEEGEIEETFSYIIETDKSGEPTKMAPVPKHDRNAIQVHYLPARRDPADHVTYAATSLLGRALGSANWTSERETVTKHAQRIGGALAENSGVEDIGKELARYWEKLHKGSYFATPNISFQCGEIDQLLRHLTIGFTPGEAENTVDFSRLSDGQKSLLYLTLVLSLQGIGRKVLGKELDDGTALGSDFEEFRERFCTPNGGYTRVDELRERMASLSLRRLKAGTVSLPPQTFSRLSVKLAGQQLRMYEEIRNNLALWVHWLSDEEVLTRAENILSRLIRLAQLASNPALIDSCYRETPAKFQTLDEILPIYLKHPFEKVIIWTSFVQNITTLQSRFHTLQPVALHGEMGRTARDAAVSSFKRHSNVRLLVANPAAAREGFQLGGFLAVPGPHTSLVAGEGLRDCFAMCRRHH